MIQVVKATVAMSIQDQGRIGHRHEGICRSGAMDPISLLAANAIAGASPASAGIELGPGPCELLATGDATMAIAGARRDGAEMWAPISISAGKRLQISAAVDGVWSYVALAGGVRAPIVMDSRSTCVREGIGLWLQAGDTLWPGADVVAGQTPDVPDMSGPIRVFGHLPGTWSVSTRIDRMGYMLEGEPMTGASPDEWSEPIPVGAIQLTPSGLPFVMMAEGSTAGGYPIIGYVHPDDLRLLAQTPSGKRLSFVPA